MLKPVMMMNYAGILTTICLTINLLFPSHTSANETLTVAIPKSGDDLSFYPTHQRPGESSFLRELTTPPIVAVNEQWQWVCVLCTGFPSEEANTVWQAPKSKFPFKTAWRLKGHFKWSDGTPVTAKDVKYTLNLMFRQELDLSQVDRALPLFKVDLDPEDPYRLVISFKEARFDFYQIMAVSLLPAHHQNIIEKFSDIWHSKKDFKQAAGILTRTGLYYGPYQIKALDTKHAQLVQNSFFPGSQNEFKTMDVRSFDSFDKIQKAFENNELDFIAEDTLSIDQAKRLLDADQKLARGFKIIGSHNEILEQLVVNLRNPYLSDPAIRKALMIAIDRDQILSDIFHSYGKVAYRFTPSPKDGQTSLQIYPHNPKLARRWLDNAGWKMTEDGFRVKNKQKLTFEIATDKNSLHSAIAKQLQSDWKAIGVKTKIRTHPGSTFVSKLLTRRRFPGMALLGFPHGPGAYWFGRFHSRQIPKSANQYQGWNFGSWENKKMDQLIKSFHKSHDFDEQRTLVNQISTEIFKELPVFPLVYRPKIAVIRETIGNVRFPGLSYHTSLYANDWTKLNEKRELF
jgi:peptide/nickel transport system substrate-binding protein